MLNYIFPADLMARAPSRVSLRRSQGFIIRSSLPPVSSSKSPVGIDARDF